MTFSANFNGALLNVTGINYSLICFYNNIPRVLLHREGFFCKNKQNNKKENKIRGSF